MKLNAKGQVTIPARLRHRYGFVEGDEVEVIDDGGVLRVVHTGLATAGERAVERVRGTAGKGLTTDEVMAMTRGR